ncbi:M20/M25/M40 family metallo-hydrolase [Pelomonas aquatica]|jgi:glutamate carboxypeptidase|uniref:M20/M25/M40 family metallo-hydrolase n=1 Tax=Pelomonas aquatica TaxID=431058 RepID=A0A9X4LG28_9BURK|nr:M20/M25/M40 family metallo-hydrolase [Pelomonas aquatica]MCY4753144.1 M20/M25/M40 family metallo-hydrolase [Pelomonas aquatica]MDG0862792.1 M20/M25/M40 family metallo-hydrolase [Pelomonas aquatica]
MKTRHPLRSAAALLLFTFAASAWAGGLDAQEQQIVAHVKRHTPEALRLLERSVLVNSGTLNPAGVREVGALYAKEFESLGFGTRWVDMPPAMQRAGHLVAERRGTQGRRLLLIGHLDTVFEKDSPVPPWRSDGSRVSGQGVSDMKGGDVIILLALRALHEAGALDGRTVRAVFTGDEERVGSPVEVARAALVDAARQSDAALAFEGATRDDQGRDAATIGRRASAGWQLQVTARTGHSAGVFGRDGFGALYEAARVLDAFRTRLIEPDLTFNAATLVGGTSASWDDAQSQGQAYGKSNVIPRDALVRGDLRYLTPEQGAKARERMQAIVEQALPGTRSRISFREAYPPMAPTPGNLKLLEAYSRASADAGLGEIAPFPPGQRGAGDVQFVASLVDSLDGLGAAGGGAHTPDEWLDIASIERGAIRAALLIYRLTR